MTGSAVNEPVMKASSLIVVGTPFSGAALLGHALGAHSQAFFAGELWRLWDLGADPGTSACRTCGAGCETWSDPSVAAAVANGPAAVSAALAAATGSRLVIEGPASASWLAARLAHGEPSGEDARIVVCVCDPLLYVRKRAGVTEEHAKQRVAEWRDEQNALMSAALSSGRPLLLVRYEDLANRIEETLTRACTFAGITYEPALALWWEAPTHAIGATSEAWGVARPAHTNPDPPASGDPRQRRVETVSALDHEPGEALGADVAHTVIAELRPTGLCEAFGYEPLLPPCREPWDDAERQNTAAWVREELHRTREAVLDDRASDAITTLQMLVGHFGPAFDDLGLESKYEHLAVVLVDLLNNQQRFTEALPYARALARHAPHNPEAHRLLAVASPGTTDAPAPFGAVPPCPPPGTPSHLSETAHAHSSASPFEPSGGRTPGPRRDDLASLAAAFMTDKEGAHHYAQHYQRHFQPLRWQKLNILEIGVGGYEHPREGGASLRMWKAYFPNSRIFGIDIHDKSYLDEDRIRTFHGSQVDEAFLRSVAAETGPIDIVIDDGSHLNEHVITTFKILFPFLSPNGIYVAEDLQTSYWEQIEGHAWDGSKDLKAPHTSMTFFKNLVDGLNHEEFTVDGYVPSYWDEHIISMHFCHNLVFVYKGLNNEGSNLIPKARPARADEPREETVAPGCRWLNIEFSSMCNLRCRWCILDHDKPKQFLPLDTLERILQQIARGEMPDLERIDLHNGGEALLHPELDAALELLARYRRTFPRPVHVGLLTNGTVLRESTLALLASGATVDEIRVSVDGGTPENYERIRTNARWAQVSHNVERISAALSAARSKTTLGIICMVAPDKPLDVGWMDPDFTAVLRLADNLELRHPHTWEGSLKGIDGLAADTTRKQKDQACVFLKHNLVVMANGDVSVCCADLNGRGTIGTMDQQSLAELANGATRRHLITLWRQGRFDEMPACSGCQGYYDPALADSVAPLPVPETDERALEGMTLRQLEEVVQREPGNRVARNHLGVRYCQRGDPAKALEHLTAAVAAGGAGFFAHKNLANLHELLRNFDEAADLYECILRRQPDDVDALSGLGRLGIEAGRFDSARRLFQRVVEIDPANADAATILESIPDSNDDGFVPGAADSTGVSDGDAAASGGEGG